MAEEFEARDQARLERSENDVESQTVVIFHLVDHFVKKIVGEPLPYFFKHDDAQVLANVIRKAEFGIDDAHLVYSRIVIDLNAIAARLDSDSKEYVNVLGHRHTHATLLLKAEFTRRW
ncbi:MAG: hypothetical protein IPJ30_22370 [Acidobacteria bacterium]|nr:hypothetical protein [Acidobacteriota bacterium]